MLPGSGKEGKGRGSGEGKAGRAGDPYTVVHLGRCHTGAGT